LTREAFGCRIEEIKRLNMLVVFKDWNYNLKEKAEGRPSSLLFFGLGQRRVNAPAFPLSFIIGR